MKMLFLLVVMMVPKQTCIDAWNARRQVVYVKSSDGKLEPRAVPVQNDPQPQVRYDVLVTTSATVPSASPDILRCFDVYAGHSPVGVKLVEEPAQALTKAKRK